MCATHTAQDLGAAFEKALREEPAPKEKGLDFRLRRPVTVQEFFEEFIADRAPLGVDKYHGACRDGVRDVWARTAVFVLTVHRIVFASQP
jgi:hypothetical protein